MLKVTAVSYLNTKPLLFGLISKDLHKSLQLTLDHPAACAEKLRSGEADLALIPVAAIPEIPNATIVSDFCIGAIDKVRSVVIYSDVPIEEIKTLLLDYESRTSVALSFILIQEYWKVNPVLHQTNSGFESLIQGNTAAVVIGDKALELEGKFKYTYDLAEAWKSHTGLPFVFAAWVATKELEPAFINHFNEALAYGIEHIPSLMYILPNPGPQLDLYTYFTENISYHLDAEKRNGLQLFLDKWKIYEPIFRELIQNSNLEKIQTSPNN